MRKRNLSLEDLRNSKCANLNPHLFEIKIEQKKEKKTNKYSNIKKEVDGIIFDSKKEAEYYKKLKLRLKAGDIGMLELQVPFELNPGGAFSYKYIADFVFIDAATGEKQVLDVKGFRTSEYRKKRRLMRKLYGITVIEI